MDNLISTIKTSIDSLAESINDNITFSDESISKSSDGISLLALKNDAMLSYVHNVILIIAAKLAKITSDDNTYTDEIIKKATEGSIVQRVVLEKGVKGLETKIAYQIEKVLRAHSKLQQEAEKKQQMLAEQREVNGQAGGSDNDDSDSDDDALNYRPNPMALKGSESATNGRSRSSKTTEETEEPTSASKEKYKAPKIAAVTPFTSERKGRKQRNSTMDEYIKELSTAPSAEPSIGSTIMDNGRGGERTERDRAKQKEIQNYEEENYTRLPGLSQKQEKKAARQRQRDAFGKSFFGEDWSFLDRKNNNSGVEASSKRRKETTSVWERTKKRQRH